MLETILRRHSWPKCSRQLRHFILPITAMAPSCCVSNAAEILVSLRVARMRAGAAKKWSLAFYCASMLQAGLTLVYKTTVSRSLCWEYLRERTVKSRYIPPAARSDKSSTLIQPYLSTCDAASPCLSIRWLPLLVSSTHKIRRSPCQCAW